MCIRDRCGTQAIKGAFVEAIRATMGEYSGFQVMSGNKFGYTLFTEILCTWLGKVGTTTKLQIGLNAQKNPYLNQATQQKYLPHFPAQLKTQNQKFQPCVVLS